MMTLLLEKVRAVWAAIPVSITLMLVLLLFVCKVAVVPAVPVPVFVPLSPMPATLFHCSMQRTNFEDAESVTETTLLALVPAAVPRHISTRQLVELLTALTLV
jgi:hypothetical protein